MAPLTPMACAPDGVQSQRREVPHLHAGLPALERRPARLRARLRGGERADRHSRRSTSTCPTAPTSPTRANLLGYAFATTSYSVNGLAIPQGLADLVDLVNIFRARIRPLQRVYLVGVSEGGLITTLATETASRMFSTAGWRRCGPIGDFRRQINYVGDFRGRIRLLLSRPDARQPSAIPPGKSRQTRSPTGTTSSTTTIAPELVKPSSAISVTQLLAVTRAPYDPSDPTTTIAAHNQPVLWYSMYATNDAVAKLGGQPFDNRTGSIRDR